MQIRLPLNKEQFRRQIINKSSDLKAASLKLEHSNLGGPIFQDLKCSTKSGQFAISKDRIVSQVFIFPYLKRVYTNLMSRPC